MTAPIAIGTKGGQKHLDCARCDKKVYRWRTCIKSLKKKQYEKCFGTVHRQFLSQSNGPWLPQLLPKNLANVYCAGIETHGLNPCTVAITKEDGIDISEHTSNHVDEYEGIQWNFIITVCHHAKENCSFIPAENAQRLHHNFFDPSKVDGTAEEKHNAFMKTRNEIKEFCETFVKEELAN